MYTIRQILGTTLGLTVSGVKMNQAQLTVAPTESPEDALTKKLQTIRDTNSSAKDAEYAKVIAEAFPNDLKKQLEAVNTNKGA